MRQIEQEMINAMKAGSTMYKANTMVFSDGSVYLHNNHIGTYSAERGTFTVNLYTLDQWPTPTTKSRLRSIGIDVTTKDYVTYVRGLSIGELRRLSDAIECEVKL
jgi:hypothetical protein